MNKRNIAFLIAGIVVGMLLLGLKGFIPEKEKKPEIAGQEVPATNFVIDFNKRYNLIYSENQEGKAFQNIKIIGYTGTKVKESSGSFSDDYSFFNHWLVIERIDGRKVFVPTSGISYMEEADTAKK
jgi:hypothetical protein